METVLSNETKRIIDDARDTLVGQIPVPMMQCQQITLALTYKFMSDDDQQAVDLGGRRHYFTGDLEQYEWSRIVSLRLDDTQRSELYRNGLAALQGSESLPAVFREIFKDAMVPYGDHRTLALFLQTMDRMEYDDSEKLGDAYEYLLKIAESQADAGQFRTPRHIIDFIVSIINPQKHEAIIDPACGTAGFLISAYQHIKNQHRLPGGGTTLSTPDLTRLADNLKGYDISPEMTKLAMANIYLHTQDKNPNIDNYDTLTSTDHWNEFADVMLANPPFMSPRGGIKPHGLFRVPAKRAEVLFVDYIASHLNEYGRAGIIVPEGIIFQSQKAYKQLRRLLVEESLVAVISLPAGVFKPYSGVKTSVLILDKVLAPKGEHVAFFKVENDGYDLGDQRRSIERNDLPQVETEVGEYFRRLRVGEQVEDFQATLGMAVEKEKLAAEGEYNLSGERYREAVVLESSYPFVPVGNFYRKRVKSVDPRSTPGDYFELWSIPAFDKGNPEILMGAEIGSQKNIVCPGDVLLSRIVPHIRRAWVVQESPAKYCQVGSTEWMVFPSEQIIPEFLRQIVTCNPFHTQFMQTITGVGGSLSRANPKAVANIQVPLPPLELQRELVAEIEGYQRVIGGAKMVVENWRPQITVDPEWSVAGIEDLVPDLPHSFKAGPFGSSLKKDCYVPAGYKVYGQEQVIRGDAKFGDYYIEQEKYRELESCRVQAGDVLVSLVGTYGKAMIIPDDHEPGIINPRLVKITLDRRKMIPEFFTHLLTQDQTVAQMQAMSHGGTMGILTMQTLKRLRIPVPPVGTQQVIVDEIEAEQALVSANRELAERMERRVQDAIARVWEG